MFRVRYQNLEESWKSLKFKILTEILFFQLIFLCGHQNAGAFFASNSFEVSKKRNIVKDIKKIRVYNT